MLVSFMVNIYKGSQVFDTLGMTKILFLLVCLSSNLKSTSLLKMFSSCRPQLSLNLSSFTASLPFIFRLINCCMEKPMAADCRDILWEIFHSILGSFPMTVKNTLKLYNYVIHSISLKLHPDCLIWNFTAFGHHIKKLSQRWPNFFHST